MSYFVYILYSKRDRKLYTGCAANLEKRISAHNTGKVLSTQNRRPLVLIHSETFQDKGEAFKRERFLKSLWSGKIKKKILKDYLKNAAKPILLSQNWPPDPSD